MQRSRVALWSRPWTGSQSAWSGGLALLSASFVILGKSLSLSVPQLSSLENEGSNTPYLAGGLRGLNEFPRYSSKHLLAGAITPGVAGIVLRFAYTV